MKVIICGINSKYIHSSLAIWYLASGIDKYAHGIEYAVVEGTINESCSEILNRMNIKDGDTIAFSTYIWNKNLVFEIARRAKEIYDVKIVLGGPEVSYNQEDVMAKNQFVDYILSGEGEKSLAMLCCGEDISNIEGLSYRDGGKIIIKEACVSFDDPPSPYSKEYFERLNGRIAYIETSRGCPYKCGFCLSGRCEGVRFFDLEESKKRILLLSNSGTKVVKFIDRTFNANKKRAVDIIEFISKNYGKSIPNNVRFHFEIEGEIIDDCLVEALAKSPKGAFQVEIGVQSFNVQTLKSVNRKTNIDKLVRNIRRVIELGNVHVHVDLIVGLPYEGMESFKLSFNQAYKLKANMLQIGFLKVLHGTKLEEEAGKYFIVNSNTPPYEIVSNAWLTEKEIEFLKEFERIFERLYNSGRFVETLKYLETQFDDSFEMYKNLTLFMSGVSEKASLDEFTKAVYEYFSSFDEINRDLLRDKIVIDRLASIRMGCIPSFLKKTCSELKRIMISLDENQETRRKLGIKRKAAALCSENRIVYVDYDIADPITGRYEVNFVDMK